MMIMIDTSIDEAIIELLKIRNYGYIGIDVRIRDGRPNEYTVNSKEEYLPENTNDDDITRLNEKLELLRKIEEVLEKLKKYVRDEPNYVPIPYWPRPYNPWYKPRITWTDTQSSSDTVKINWSFSDTDGTV